MWNQNYRRAAPPDGGGWLKPLAPMAPPVDSDGEEAEEDDADAEDEDDAAKTKKKRPARSKKAKEDEELEAFADPGDDYNDTKYANTVAPRAPTKCADLVVADAKGETKRNFSRFRKNHVVVADADEIVTRDAMLKVMADESERELALRRDTEALEREAVENDVLFNDDPSDKPKKKPAARRARR